MTDGLLQVRKLRVLTMIDSLSAQAGGGERMAALVAMNLDPSRFESVICATRPSAGGPLLAEAQAAGLEVLCLDRRSRMSLLAWRPLLALLRRRRIDILHAHKFGSNVWGAVFGTLARVPVFVAHEHSWSYEGNTLRRILDREVVARFSTTFLAVSRHDLRRMVEIERIDPDHVRLLPNGIAEPTMRGTDVRAELRIPADAPVIATAGGLRPEKAFDLLIESAALLVDRFPTLRVLIAGRGPEEERLRSLIRGAGVENAVLLLGARSDVPDLLAAADVAVCCSDREGSPLSVMEYMAAGKPVVATRVGGVPDLVAEGWNGLLVDPRDAEALAEALAEILSMPDRGAALGARGQERQRQDYGLRMMMRRIEDLYEELFLASDRARGEGWRPMPRP